MKDVKFINTKNVYNHSHNVFSKDVLNSWFIFTIITIKTRRIKSQLHLMKFAQIAVKYIWKKK